MEKDSYRLMQKWVQPGSLVSTLDKSLVTSNLELSLFPQPLVVCQPIRRRISTQRAPVRTDECVILEMNTTGRNK